MTSLSSKQQADLLEELDKLKRKAGLGFELEVQWIPGKVKYSKEGKELRGEVLGNKIFVYDSNFDVAKQTLKHEFVEYFINQAIDPYRRALVSSISFFEDRAYNQREKIVKALVKLLSLD